jgi:hypothetical protein
VASKRRKTAQGEGSAQGRAHEAPVRPAYAAPLPQASPALAPQSTFDPWAEEDEEALSRRYGHGHIDFGRGLYALSTEPPTEPRFGVGALFLSFAVGAAVMGAAWKYTAKPADLAQAGA